MHIINTSSSSHKPKPPVRLLLIMIGGATLVSIFLWLIFAALIGKDLANVALGISGSCMATFIVSRWESIKIKPDVKWRDYIKLLRLKLWKIVCVFLAAFIWQFVFGIIFGFFQLRFRPEFIDSLPDGFLEFMQAYSADSLTSVVLAISALISFFLGGYVAGKLSRDQYLAPYSHAVIGVSLHHILTIALMWDSICNCLTLESGGYLLVGLLLGILSSILGVKLAIRKRTYPQNKRFAATLGGELNNLSASTPIREVAQIVYHASKSNTHDGKKLQMLLQKKGKHNKRRRRK